MSKQAALIEGFAKMGFVPALPASTAAANKSLSL
jgi:hypothetical protein